MRSAAMAEITEKYFSRSVGANVTFGRGPNNDYTCDIVAPVRQGVVLKASHNAREALMAFNGAADRIEKQLRRYMRRLKDHKAEGERQPYVENAGYTIFSAAADGADEEESSPAIVAETRVDIPEASVSDAVMLMDLRNTNALMFRNQRDRRLQHDLPPRRREHRLGRAADGLTPFAFFERRACDGRRW